MKYCKDCRHCFEGLALGLIDPPGCRRFSYSEEMENPIYGIQHIPHWASCRKMREEGGECGPEARAFEQRERPQAPTLWKRFANWAM